ncbi:DSCAM [Branchiostoma lanceolatum]|uniref:DSCAM protein n=1 Tax=Branchiostoma lanceolatum TaxID=7740 RepID=A0A8K0EB32_BRALA|nr:DSCAM [Branchiostoma lanceolatum]
MASRRFRGPQSRSCWLTAVVLYAMIAVSQAEKALTVQGMAGDTVTLPGNYDPDRDKPVIALTWNKLDSKVEGTRHVVYMFTPKNSMASGTLKERAVFHRNGSLTIRDIRDEDEGQYVMTLLIDAVGQQEHFVNLNVVVPPIVDMGVESPYLVSLGTDVVLNCTVDKSNSIVDSVSWLKDGRPLSDSIPKDYYQGLDFYKSSVVLKNMSKHDIGNYTCLAKNFGTQETGSILLQAKYPARITNSSAGLTTTIESSATLWCTTEGIPPPKITWYKGDREKRQGTIIEGNVTYMTIRSVRVSDSGSYKCSASNGLGAPDSRTMVLSVNGPEASASASSSGSSISDRWIEFGIIVGGAVVGATLLLTSLLIVIIFTKRQKSKSHGCQACHVVAISHSHPNLCTIGDDVCRGAEPMVNMDQNKHLLGRYLARAIQDYKPTGEGGLTLEINDIVEVLHTGRDGWWYGYMRGNFGFFPARAVTVLTCKRRVSIGGESSACPGKQSQS